MHTASPPGHLASFDGLRLLAALSVIFSHSFLLATGSEETEPFVRLLGPKNILGLYGVYTFFSISGFLLAGSLTRNPSLISYVVNRALRILPAFVFCVLLTVLLVGPTFSSVGTREYFSHPSTGRFLTMSLNTLGDMPLPGVFGYDEGTLAQVVNGSLWTLRYEALSYVFLLVLWVVLRSSGAVAVVIAGIAAGVSIAPAAADLLPGIAYTLPYFAGGVVMHWIHARYGTTWQGAACCAAGLIASAAAGVQAGAFAVFGSYLIVFVGERRVLAFRAIDRLGDCSYGLYLFGWPVQQMVRQLTGTTDAMALFLLAAPPALLLGWISCHMVERPAMGLRRPIAARTAAAVQATRKRLGRGAAPAAHAGKVCFIIGSGLVLLSRTQWWYFAESMAAVLTGTVIGGLIVGVTCGMLGPSAGHAPHPHPES